MYTQSPNRSSPSVSRLSAEESQMLVQLAMPRSSRDTLSVPITGDPPPAIFLWLELHEPCHDDTHARNRRIGACRVFFTTMVPIV